MLSHGLSRNCVRLFHSTRINFENPQIRKRATFKDLVKTPLVKSIFLTLLFGSAVIEFMKRNREIRNVEEVYELKLQMLQDLADNIREGKKIDIAAELKLINSLAKHNYKSVTDLRFDEGLEQLLKEAEGQDNNESKQSIMDKDAAEDVASSSNTSKKSTYFI